MDVEFAGLPVSVPRGTPFAVTVVVRHVDVGDAIDITLSNPLGVAPQWAEQTQNAVARAVSAGATEGFATATFNVTLGGPCDGSHLLAEAQDTANFLYKAISKRLVVT